MKESEFIKVNFKLEISNFCANVKVKITSLKTAVRQLANTLTVREFSKWIIQGDSRGIINRKCNPQYIATKSRTSKR
jgi:hypothetical protein